MPWKRSRSRWTATLIASALAAGCHYIEGSLSDDEEGGPHPSASADSASVDSTAAADSTSATAEAVPVETASAIAGDISSYLLFSSTIETEAAVEVFAEVTGLVRLVSVEEGDHVVAGDTLVRLDDDRARIEDQESEVNLRHLQTGFERMEEMYRRQLISSQTYEDRQFELEQARLRRARAQLALEHTVVRAPLSGVITSRRVQLGSRVSTAAKLFDLVTLEDMIARVYVPGKYLADVVVGQRAEVESHFLQGRSFEGQVKRISPVVDPNSGTFKVTVGLGDEWRDLRPGVFVNVRIVTDTHRNAVLLPKQAVVYDGGERYVFVVADSTATRVKLDAGFEDNHYVEALSLIAPRVPIIVVGQNGLRDSSLVKVMNAVSDDPPPGHGASADTSAEGSSGGDSTDESSSQG